MAPRVHFTCVCGTEYPVAEARPLGAVTCPTCRRTPLSVDNFDVAWRGRWRREELLPASVARSLAAL